MPHGTQCCSSRQQCASLRTRARADLFDVVGGKHADPSARGMTVLIIAGQSLEGDLASISDESGQFPWVSEAQLPQTNDKGTSEIYV